MAAVSVDFDALESKVSFDDVTEIDGVMWWCIIIGIFRLG